ncbi:methyltransferase [Streptomyces sp. NPDC049040]|uniref:methyltransferase n=1 Tax=Streptomyces sp. NPDC049040 TaxID=3365593 RepID=UPI00371BB448
MTASQDEIDVARGDLTRLVFGQMAARVLGTALRLGVFDRFGRGADGGRSAAEVASDLGTDPRATLRLLRAMAALRLLTEGSPDHFALAPAGALLHGGGAESPSGDSVSMAAFVRLFTGPLVLSGWDHLGDSLRSGEPSFEAAFGVDCFTFLTQNPEGAAEFNAAMSQGTSATAAGLAGAYDFDRFKTVVDVGGGDGTLLAAILRGRPALRGMVFDTAAGVAEAGATLAREELAERCTVHAGDFFTGVPAGGDLYLLKSVLIDWDDDRCVGILEQCRRAVPDDGRLLIVENILPPTVNGSTPPGAYLSDLNMLVNTGGRVRTRAELERLCTRAGFTPTGLTPLPPPFAALEAAPS